MQTMTTPAQSMPVTLPPMAAPAPKKTHKGLIFLAVLIGLGVIGAAANASDRAANNATLHRAVTNSLVNNTTAGGVDETGYVRDTCASTLDMHLAGVSETFREGLANGHVTIATLADSFAKGYYDKDGGAGTDLSRSQVVGACTAGLYNAN
jgi:hypothetical protein